MTGVCEVKPACSRFGPRSDEALIARYGERVPRYTSYPTAPHFSPAVGEEIYRPWLSALDPQEAVSLYVHVPFCERLCWYCGCNTTVVHRYQSVSAYVDTLIAEIELMAAAIGTRPRVSMLHFGGGTPNILSISDFERITAGVGRKFVLDATTEIAAELDPRTLTSEWVENAVLCGLTRASLGVQDLDPVVQASIDRLQPFEMTQNAVSMLREAGVGSINLDLMYGLPHQTKQGVEATLDEVLDLVPDRIALFGYAHVPWIKPHQKLIRDEDLPGPLERHAQHVSAAGRLEAAGYVRIGLDHFAREDDPLAKAMRAGTVHRNFQGYTTDDAGALIGFGASSISRLPQGYVQNAASVPAWRDAVESGHLPATRGFALTPEDRFRAEIIERLMCDFAVDLTEVATRHDVNPNALQVPLLHLCGLAADGIVTRQDSIIRVTHRGRPFVRSVCAVFDAYIAGSRDAASIPHSTGV
jgi:oxygen-independent coproporphyrinogen-3 oxidase